MLKQICTGHENSKTKDTHNGPVFLWSLNTVIARHPTKTNTAITPLTYILHDTTYVVTQHIIL